MTRDDLEALAKELEQAERGTQKLSDRMLLACGWSVEHEQNKSIWTSPNQESWASWGVPPRPSPTESVDAALELVPAGWTWDVDATVPEAGIDWNLWAPNSTRESRIKGIGNTPVLALCAAILRAKAQDI